jgi:hypothetical protein
MRVNVYIYYGIPSAKTSSPYCIVYTAQTPRLFSVSPAPALILMARILHANKRSLCVFPLECSQNCGKKSGVHQPDRRTPQVSASPRIPTPNPCKYTGPFSNCLNFPVTACNQVVRLQSRIASQPEISRAVVVLPVQADAQQRVFSAGQCCALGRMDRSAASFSAPRSSDPDVHNLSTSEGSI